MSNQIIPPSEVHYPINVQQNTNSLYYLKSTSSSISGATAGILGLTNLYGFGFYFISCIFVGILAGLTNRLSIIGGRGGRGAGKVVKGGWSELIWGGMLENLFGYILFWTLFYALCHIYY